MTDVKVKRPLWFTLTACGFAAVLFTSVAIGGLAWYRQSAMNQESLQTKADSDLALLQNDMAAIQRASAAMALSMAGDPAVIDLVAKGDRPGLLEKYVGSLPAVAENSGLSRLTFANANGMVIARAHTPDKFDDDMKGRRKTVVSALNSGKLFTGIEPGRVAISIFATAPVVSGGKIVGVVDVGTELGNAYFQPIADKFGGEIAIDVLIDGKFETQSSTENDKSLLTPEQVQAAFDGKPVFVQKVVGNRDLVIKAVPFTNISGETLGVIEVASDATKIVAASTHATWTSALVSLVISLLALIGFFIFARSLAVVIGRLTGTMSRLAAGDLEVNIEGDGRRDEIGAMAAAVQVFKDNALRTCELEREATANREESEAQRIRAAEQDRIRAEAMAQATTGLATGLKQLAAGDLTVQLTEVFAEDFESLRSDFNLAVEQLRTALCEVVNATNNIDNGSREISQSADDLSKRTEKQAASLEETAAALDEITTNVSNSSKRAEEARAVAIEANENARRSGVVVANAVDAMGLIEKSSDQISNIIGVIDDIAFQTNLLALNAGVEAARAGEAGKGFAVVAQEVRELAQRSATAAKEIKELITASSAQVENGVKLVSQTGDALKTIETSIVTINQHMEAIATSAREQSTGLAEVNTAVNQMDQVTQQNSAMVEETNAASATLASEAGRLRRLVEGFRLDVAGGRGLDIVPSTAGIEPAPSPARRMVGKIARAFTGKGAAATAASHDSWEEF